MGLIKAFTTSTSGVLGDQFKEYVTCPTMDKDVLVQIMAKGIPILVKI